MITVRHAADRGRADFGWLDSRHTFSFGHYYDPNHMGFSALRVINDDTVQPGAGFDTHGHRDMEIISYVLEGEIAHKDSEGNVKVLPAGEFQLMSAGSGIYHSEYNHSSDAQLHFLQIWIQPNVIGEPPGYQQKDFGQNSGLTSIATPHGDNGTLSIKQDATLHQLILEPQQHLEYPIAANRNVYVHQITGQLLVDQTFLQPGDGAKVQMQTSITLANNSDQIVKALVFDLP
ncbi:pirin family protein [Vibrio olivae]|uniref:Pirin family protein n=1 Tax=Vibrio olivae TaxID=1243002 RepID=A0ABV5HPG0_9VIBR